MPSIYFEAWEKGLKWRIANLKDVLGLTLIFPLESKPSSWFTISSIVLWTSLSPPACMIQDIRDKSNSKDY